MSCACLPLLTSSTAASSSTESNDRPKHRYALLKDDKLIVAYDAERRVPKWVYETISKTQISGPLSRKKPIIPFAEDERLREDSRATLDDYATDESSSLGHNAAAGNHKTTLAVRKKTFLLSNIAPQDRHLNARYWNTIENDVRALTETAKKVHVLTGPLFLPQKAADGSFYVKYRVIGTDPLERPVAVPTHFFKIAIAEVSGDLKTYALIVPNEPVDGEVPRKDFATSLSRVQKLAGIDIATILPKRIKPDYHLVDVLPKS